MASFTVNYFLFDFWFSKTQMVDLKNIDEENKNKNNNCKKGFKYKVNHLYDELIKKDKIKEQNILLQAIRYLLNIKNDE